METQIHIANENPLLNEVILHDLFDAFGPEAAFELIGEFVGALDCFVAQLDDVQWAADIATFIYITHKLTGTAGMFGATRLSNLASELNPQKNTDPLKSIGTDSRRLQELTRHTAAAYRGFEEACRAYCDCDQLRNLEYISGVLAEFQAAA
jgi:HPt (histidine-containing phosphotransfer) domain-containing protein